MLLENERKEIIIYGKKMITDGLTRGTGGNISICDAEQKLMAITPSGIDYFKLTPEDIVIIDVETGSRFCHHRGAGQREYFLPNIFF